MSANQLQTNAFFDLSSQYIIDVNENPLLDDNTQDLALYGTNGSAYAETNRDRILSDAIPALTGAVGANFVGILGAANNINMQTTFETGWPSALSTGREAYFWYHSDFNDVAYPFTHTLFDNIVSLGGLK